MVVIKKTESYSEQIKLVETELTTLFELSQLLNNFLPLNETLHKILHLLHDSANLTHGMVSFFDQEQSALLVTALHDDISELDKRIRYRVGEGIIGTVIKTGKPIVVARIIEDSRFLDRLGIYDLQLPFIGVPITVGKSAQCLGVLSAQPANRLSLQQQMRFLETVANLIGQRQGQQQQFIDEKNEFPAKNAVHKRTTKIEHGYDNIIGSTPAMNRVFELIRQVSKWNTTVLIRGESGTGKELIANAIHYNSPRANGAFIKLNCAALPDNLLESELFGHEKGAFTGALSLKKGRFEQAHGGTLFLDEIGEISAAFQAKLLRVLQLGEFERLGGVRTLKVDVRVIAATNRDLEEEVEKGSFREDLYYRLNVMPINLPPLRERIEDIPELARFLLNKLAQLQGRDLLIKESAIRQLMRYEWPGNVRELENCLERAAIMCEHGSIDRETISFTGLEDRGFSADQLQSLRKVDFNDPQLDERERVIAALEEAGWVQAKAARLLNMTPRQIAYRIQTLNIKIRRI